MIGTLSCLERRLVWCFSLRRDTCKMSASSARPINKSCMDGHSVVPHDHGFRCPFDSYMEISSQRNMIIQEILKNSQIIVDANVFWGWEGDITSSISLSSCLKPTTFRVTDIKVSTEHIEKSRLVLTLSVDI